MQVLYEDSLAATAYWLRACPSPLACWTEELFTPASSRTSATWCASSACRPHLPVNAGLTSPVTSWRMQAATYCFVLGAAHMVLMDQCFSMVLGHGALQQHGIAQSVHSILQASEPRHRASCMVWSRAHLEPGRIVSYVWPLCLQALGPGAVPATQVQDDLLCMAHTSACQATASCSVAMSVHSRVLGPTAECVAQDGGKEEGCTVAGRTEAHCAGKRWPVCTGARPCGQGSSSA